MYICRECKAEYKQKVDYCDCGNNTFDFVEDAPVQAFKNTEKYTANIKAPKDIISSAFFVICLILSIIVWLIPVKVHLTKLQILKSTNNRFKKQIFLQILIKYGMIHHFTPLKRAAAGSYK